MAKAKTKTTAPALAVPQTDAEADALLAQYGAGEIVLAKIQAALTAETAAVKAKHEKTSGPLQEEQNDLLERIQAWAGANRSRLTGDDKTKTVAMPAGKIGWRSRPPSVVLKRGLKIADIVETLKSMGLRRFLRVALDINKDRLLEERETRLKDVTIPGISFQVGVEDFFVEPVSLELAEPK